MKLPFVISAVLILAPLPLHSVRVSALDLSSIDRQHLLNDQFAIVTSVAAIPEVVIRRFRELAKTDGMTFAEPGADFQATDVIDPGRKLLARRLVFAGVSKEYCFIHYEKGGVAHVRLLVLFRMSKESASFVWGAQCNSQFKDLKEMRAAVASNRLTKTNYW